MAENNLEKKFLDFVYEIKAVDEDEMIIRGIVGSDGSTDRHGDRVNPDGWKLDNFKKNPVILLNHNYWDFPVAKAIKVAVKDGKLLFDIQFSKTYEVAKTAFNLMKEKILNATSVGFLVLKWGETGSKFTIDQQELLELSLVTVPANANALSQEQLSLVKSLETEMEKLNANRGGNHDKAQDEGKKEEAVNGQNKVEEKPEATVTKTEDIKSEADEQREAVSKLVAEEVAKQLPEAIKAFIGTTKSQNDEEQASDPVAEALLAFRQELKLSNQASGKTLKAFNAFVETLQK